MRNIRKFWAIALLAVVMCCGFLVGCGGKPTVNLNDYVVMDATGYDGYGTVSASLNFSKLIEDNAEYLTDKSLDTTYFGDQTAQMAAEFIFYNNKPFVLAYTAPENAKNGDKVEFTWNTSEEGIEKLSQVLEVKFKYDNFTYEFKELQPLKTLDPFDNFTYTLDGFSGFCSCWFDNTLLIENCQFIIKVSADKQHNLVNGDTVRVSISDFEELKNGMARTQGVLLSRESIDIKIEGLNYYPVEDIKDVLTVLTEEKKQELKGNVEEYYHDLNSLFYAGEVKATYVGAILAYKDDFTYSGPKNKMFVVYHLDSSIVPGGFYTYIELGKFIYEYKKSEDGTLKKELVQEGGTDMPDYYAIGFKEGRDLIIGEKTLEELVSCIKEETYNSIAEHDLNKYVTTEELQQYIK